MSALTSVKSELRSSAAAASASGPSSLLVRTAGAAASVDVAVKPVQPVTHAKDTHLSMIIAGLVSGVSVAGLFNPWDRALYLSVLHSRPFLTAANFRHPYQGFLQVVVHRTLSGGMYFPLFDMAQPHVKTVISHFVDRHRPQASAAEQSALLHFICGNIAGGASGIFLNGLTAVKYASWNARTGFFQTTRDMYAAGGYRPFVKGINATVVRDTIFGGVFAVVKFQLVKLFHPYVRAPPPIAPSSSPSPITHSSHPPAPSTLVAPPPGSLPVPPVAERSLQFSPGTVDFTAALLAGLLATTASAPPNYVRNIKYGWPSESKPPSSYRIIIDLIKEARMSGRIASHLQERLRLGWGTARVAVGMAVGQYLYEITKNHLK